MGGLVSTGAAAFCGFYVAGADTSLFNQASKVVLARSGDRTVITMANDFQGDVDEFAIVIPVPTFIEREQIHVSNIAIVDHLDAYTAPRLVATVIFFSTLVSMVTLSLVLWFLL